MGGNKKRFVWIILSIIILAGITIPCVVYLNTYYPADTEAIEEYTSEMIVRQEILEDNTIVYTPEEATIGFIFYPGGKVEYTAYVPLMKACAEKGMLCVLMEMPFHLAVFDIDAANGIQELYPGIEDWYIGGHSLGGSMAATYLADNTDTFEGLILLGSYSTENFADSEMEVLSVYGSEDEVLNGEKYEKYKSNLPKNFTEIVIDGGCHAYFGMYGEQEGDGIPTITNAEQINLTADEIIDFVMADQ